MSDNAIVLASGSYRTPYAKTAHGLVRGPGRYKVVGVVDADCAGEEAGQLLDGQASGHRYLQLGLRLHRSAYSSSALVCNGLRRTWGGDSPCPSNYKASMCHETGAATCPTSLSFGPSQAFGNRYVNWGP